MTIRRHHVWGAVRAVTVVALAAGLVRVAATQSWSADLTASDAPRPTTTGAPAATAVRDAAVLCPGPELLGVPGVADVQVAPTVQAATAPTDLATTVLGVDPGAGRLEVGALAGGPTTATTPSTTTPTAPRPTTQRGAAVTWSVSNAHGVEAHAVDGLAPGLVATQGWRADTPTLRGLVAVPCGPATATSWLVGGGGAPGRQERLLLTNPGANEVVVDVTLHGADGVVASSAGRGLVVPARSRTALLLDSISGNEQRPVVQVVVRGGAVQATLNDAWLDGSVPAGVDDIGPAAPPSTTLVIPAVPVDGSATLRVLVPGSQDAVVQVRTIDAGGGAPLPKGGVSTVKAGTVVDIPLDGLAAGTRALQVAADVPVVAGAVVVRRAGAARGDFAWSTATPALTGLGGSALASGAGPAPDRSLSIVATGGSAQVEVSTVDADGVAATTSRAVPADTLVTLPLGAAASVWVRPVSGTGQVRAAVVETLGKGADQLVAVTPVLDAPMTTVLRRVVPVP